MYNNSSLDLDWLDPDSLDADLDSVLEGLYRRDVFTFSVMGVGGVTVSLLGIIGNIISLIILSRIQVPLSTYTFLCALCVSDMFMLITTVLLLSNDLKIPRRGIHFKDNSVFLQMFPYLNPLAFTFHVISVWLTLAFTLDRYLVICHPFRAVRLCSISKARRYTAAIFVFAIVLNLPRFFEYKTVEFDFQHTTTENVSVTVKQVFCDLTDLGRSLVFKQIYHSWFYVLFVGCLPVLMLALFNTLLLYTVKRSYKQRALLQRQSLVRRRQDTTVMLIGVVLMFFVCQTPALISRIIWTIESYQDRFETNPLYAFNEISNFLIILNSAGNIIPYYIFGTRFRIAFVYLFCKKQGIPEQMSASFSRRQSHVILSYRTQYNYRSNCFPDNRRLSSLRPTVVRGNPKNGISI